MCKDSLLAWHFKLNGPLHAGMSKLMLPEKSGDRFVSYPWLAHLLEFPARKHHRKYDCLLRTHLDDPTETKAPCVGFFYSERCDTRVRLAKNQLHADVKQAQSQKRKDACERKRQERQAVKATAEVAKQAKADLEANKANKAGKKEGLKEQAAEVEPKGAPSGRKTGNKKKRSAEVEKASGKAGKKQKPTKGEGSEGETHEFDDSDKDTIKPKALCEVPHCTKCLACPHDFCQYEQKRLGNIQSNNEVLAALVIMHA